MRKLLTILLLVSMLFYISSLFVAYKVKRVELKNEMKAFIKANPSLDCTTKFVFTTTNNNITDKGFTWKEKNKEFIFNNEMYDVVDIKMNGNTILIQCIKDNKEDELIKQYCALLNQQHNSKSTNKNSSLLKLFSQIFTKEEAYNFTFSIAQMQNTFSLITIDIKKNTKDILTPPPRC